MISLHAKIKTQIALDYQSISWMGALLTRERTKWHWDTHSSIILIPHRKNWDKLPIFLARDAAAVNVATWKTWRTDGSWRLDPCMASRALTKGMKWKQNSGSDPPKLLFFFSFFIVMYLILLLGTKLIICFTFSHYLLPKMTWKRLRKPKRCQKVE